MQDMHLEVSKRGPKDSILRQLGYLSGDTSRNQLVLLVLSTGTTQSGSLRGPPYRPGTLTRLKQNYTFGQEIDISRFRALINY